MQPEKDKFLQSLQNGDIARHSQRIAGKQYFKQTLVDEKDLAARMLLSSPKIPALDRIHLPEQDVGDLAAKMLILSPRPKFADHDEKDLDEMFVLAAESHDVKPKFKFKSGPDSASKLTTTENSGEDEVHDWLAKCNLLQYYKEFVHNGFDSMEAIRLIQADDLCYMKVRRGHRRLLMKYVKFENKNDKRFKISDVIDSKMLSLPELSVPSFCNYSVLATLFLYVPYKLSRH